MGVDCLLSECWEEVKLTDMPVRWFDHDATHQIKPCVTAEGTWTARRLGMMSTDTSLRPMLSARRSVGRSRAIIRYAGNLDASLSTHSH